ncbi:MAG: hypothetical protein ACK6A8_12560, partial [Planctomycetota bacterium]
FATVLKTGAVQPEKRAAAEQRQPITTKKPHRLLAQHGGAGTEKRPIEQPANPRLLDQNLNSPAFEV